MTTRSLVAVLGAAALVLVSFAAANSDAKSHKLKSVSIRKMADSLHAVIAADRQTYSELVVQRLDADEKRMAATENWREEHCLPVHAQMLRHAARGIQKGGAEFSYTLRSLWPINGSSRPQTQVEEDGLQAVAKAPRQPFYAEEELGGRSYFTAIYADRATLPSCVSCHNHPPRSPKKDFRQGDVMGAIVVRVPLEF